MVYLYVFYLYYSIFILNKDILKSIDIFIFMLHTSIARDSKKATIYFPFGIQHLFLSYTAHRRRKTREQD